MISPTRKKIRERIETLIDHYTPYRRITDSDKSKEIRKVLIELLDFMNGDLDDELQEFNE